MSAKTWDVQIFLSEDGPETHALAVLSTEESSQIVASGIARRSPHDEDIEEIGEELAAARALSHLAEQLLGVARGDIAEMTGELVTLTR